MNKEKANRIVALAQEVLKLQAEYKELTGSVFNVSQNLVDSVNFAQGYLAAVNETEAATIDTPKLEEVK